MDDTGEFVGWELFEELLANKVAGEKAAKELRVEVSAGLER
jgi:hypothetical protein